MRHMHPRPPRGTIAPDLLATLALAAVAVWLLAQGGM